MTMLKSTNLNLQIAPEVREASKEAAEHMDLEMFPISRDRKDSLVDLHDLVPCWLTHEWSAV